jgi:hypothetical protein
VNKDELVAHWAESERLLRELAAARSQELTADDIEAFEGYLSVNELGLAFDVLTDGALRQRAGLSREHFELFDTIARRFDLDDTEWPRENLARYTS